MRLIFNIILTLIASSPVFALSHTEATTVGETQSAAAPKEEADTDTVADANSKELDEVVVIARAPESLTTTSVIDRSAMEHLQPTSFTDLLQLLPGNMAQTPSMGSVNSITLRETGTVTATGAKTGISDDYSITSLGTLFLVDGAPINTDSNLQTVAGYSTSASPESSRDATNRGVDMRSISTDNIESVEIIRGIPGAEYGNLTSGIVNIKRIYRSSPLTARLKVDQYSKLFSVAKGFYIPGRKHVLNLDAGYLDSKVDPRNTLENYKRVNLSARMNFDFSGDVMPVLWNIGADYTGSFDNSKVDPDLNYKKIDEYKSSYNRYALTSQLTLKFPQVSWLREIVVNASASIDFDKLTRNVQVAPRRASIAPTSMEEGVHDGYYIMEEYLAHYICDGKPLAVYAKMRAAGEQQWGITLNNYSIGAEWNMSKNLGRGQVYDITHPLSASWTTRPRAYKDIPGLHTLSFFAQENITMPVGQGRLEVQAGVRTTQLTGLDSRYLLSGKIYIDPRVNAMFHFPTIMTFNRPITLFVAGGYGLTTRMPTADYLFPQQNYADYVQLNYYDINNPKEHSRVNLRTYISDPTNYNLRAARNRKWEVRVGGDINGCKLSVTYFRENMTSGFRYSSEYIQRMYREYDPSTINTNTLTAPPVLEDLNYEDKTVLGGISRVTNGSRLKKEGIEFQFSTTRFAPLRSALTLRGAWFRSTYSNSQMLYRTVNDVVGSQLVSDNYVGLYSTNDGRVNDQFNTSIMVDTQIPKWGLIFSTTIECAWWLKTRQLRDNGVPDFYRSSADGELHPFTDADKEDPVLRRLIITYNEAMYNTQTIHPALYVNLKATKSIGKALKISAFVNKLLDWLPAYKSNGLTVRRSSNPYFGMEATLTI